MPRGNFMDPPYPVYEDQIDQYGQRGKSDSRSTKVQGSYKGKQTGVPLSGKYSGTSRGYGKSYKGTMGKKNMAYADRYGDSPKSKGKKGGNKSKGMAY